jgi:hypothetical protein
LTRLRLGPIVGRFFYTTVLSAVGSAIIGLLFGFAALPSDIPALELLASKPSVGILVLALLLVLMIISPLLVPGDPQRPSARAGKDINRLYLSIGVSTLSSVLFVGLLATVLIHPTWCPTSICPAPVPITAGAHDANLDLTYVAIQSAAYVIPGDPEAVSLASSALPTQTGALRIDAHERVYRVVVGLHSLQRGDTDSIEIEHARVVIDMVTPAPTPLNVWEAGVGITYPTHPHLAIYSGQQAGEQLETISQESPPEILHLRGGEGDEMGIELTSSDAAPLVVTYHVLVIYSTS